ncbi:MBL fold metallo-hydrolase [Nocardia harenae]|uniref:MBL fold metallo-hydrolase n=1 Tax=Nocardia harenae TaxID=358707 RepID=UPI000829BD43|nr:MBL fold metallo-hydrolase [Nocardia harenae]
MTIDKIDYLDDALVAIEPSLLLEPPAGAAPGWAAAPPWFDETGWAMPLGGFLLCTGQRRIIVDAGLGPGIPDDLGEQSDAPVRNLHTGRLLGSLSRFGLAPEDVTDVVLTHLHSDHVGWVAPQGVPLFPAAAHHCHRADLDWILGGGGGSGPATAGVENTVRAVSDLLNVNDGDRCEIADAIALRLLPGHTPGNCIVDVDTDDGPVLLLGDTAHHPVLLVEDGWTDKADEDHGEATRARHSVAEEMERTGAVGWGAHFPGGRGGRVTRRADGRRVWIPLESPAHR